MDYDMTVLRKLADPRKVVGKAAYEIRKMFSPLLMERSPLRGKTFELWGEEYPYLLHRKNLTWRNERAVEVPVAQRFVERAEGVGLEFGNVLGHYGDVSWPVIDKFEVAPGVTNVDVVDFDPDCQYDWIVSVSTLEHVGWDERPRDEKKFLTAFERLRSLLAPGGHMLLTLPLGYHPGIDAAVRDGMLSNVDPSRSAVMTRSKEGGWAVLDDGEWWRYGRGGRSRAVWLGVIDSK